MTQAYSLTWQDLRVICASTLTAEERERVTIAARHMADRDHAINPNQVPVGTQVVPDIDPQWNYQDGPGSDIPARDQMIQYLLKGMDNVSNKTVNYHKLREITQLPDENPALFLARLQEALVRYTRLDPTSQTGGAVLASHFISQSAPDIRKKLCKAEDGPQTPIQDLVKMAFKVFNAREDTAEAARQARLKQKVTLQTQALVAALRPTGTSGPTGPTSRRPGNRSPPGPCFKCGQEGHWAAQCPHPRPPPGPCPICQLSGHWKSDCPLSPRVSTRSGGGAGGQGASRKAPSVGQPPQAPVPPEEPDLNLQMLQMEDY